MQTITPQSRPISKGVFLTISFAVGSVSVHGASQPEWSGQVGVASNTNSFFLNMGGPGLRFLITENSSITFNLLPSLRLSLRSEGVTRPVFGIGAGYFKQRFGFIVPVYSVPDEGWMVAAGFAYRFSAK